MIVFGLVSGADLRVAHVGCCSQSLLHCLGPARPPLAAAGGAVPVGVLQQQAQHLQVAPLGGVYQHTST